MRIEITQADIDNFRWTPHKGEVLVQSCPFARAVQRASGDREARVSSDFVIINGKPLRTPDDMKAAVRLFDSVGEIEPGVYYLTL